jgi:hypothetical protein
VNGETITIDYLVPADGRSERFPALAADCLRLKADIIVVTTTPAAQAPKNATRTIPIVIYPLGDPVGSFSVAAGQGSLLPSRRDEALRTITAVTINAMIAKKRKNDGSIMRLRSSHKTLCKQRC